MSVHRFGKAGACLLAGVSFTAATAMAQTVGPAIRVDVSAGRHAISPYIYGMAEYGVAAAYQATARLPVLRWGGDGTTRYNWQVDSSNAGFDWFFMGGDGQSSPMPSGGPDALVAADEATKSQTLLTIPMIPFINSSAAWSCSFPVSVYGAQQATNPYVFPNGQTCGNSIASNGTQLADNNIPANHVANTPNFEAEWVQHLVQKFGTASGGGVRFYQMDNEPFGWANTHRDVQPAQPTYDLIEALTERYAAAVKGIDPSARILGPSDFGWGAYVGNAPEIAEHGGLWNAPWYLQKIAAYKTTHHVQLIDYFDEHYYPTGPGDDAWLLRSTRALWDPAYVDESWIGQYYGAVQLIPRMKGWVAHYDPGLKVAISEYSWGATDRLVGALAEADVLGIFAWQGLDLATMWNVPTPTQPVAFSFLLYRNYDGAGHGFGTESVQATSADQASLSAYAAQSGSRTLTLVLINKTPNALLTPVTLANPAPTSVAQVFSYSDADLTAIHKLPSVLFASGNADITVPAMSMNILVVPLGP